jgi:hypothetical protein
MCFARCVSKYCDLLVIILVVCGYRCNKQVLGQWGRDGITGDGVGISFVYSFEGVDDLTDLVFGREELGVVDAFVEKGFGRRGERGRAIVAVIWQCPVGVGNFEDGGVRAREHETFCLGV